MEKAFRSVLSASPPPTKLILGTSSSFRRKIMDELGEEHGFKYSVLKADIDEKAIRHPNPRELVSLLAEAKAAAILPQIERVMSSDAAEASSRHLLITCDQVVVHEGSILEKPESEEEARRFIDGYGRAPASTVSSVLCTDLSTGRKHLVIDEVEIRFRPIPTDVVDKLVEEGEIMWCAGGLMIEHELVQPYIVSIGGTLDSVMGLPKQAVIEAVVKAGQ